MTESAHSTEGTDSQVSAATEIVGNGPCATCGRNPALGFASITVDGVERWYCHPDDGPSCYGRANLDAVGLNGGATFA